MRKNYKIAVMTMALAVMMAATACGSKDNGSTTAAETAAETTTAEAASEESTEEETEETTENEESSKAAEETAETPDVGTMDAGVFKSTSGTYQITIPDGWAVDEGSDDELVVFASKDGSDFLEITYVEGDDADGAREVYPATVDEYKELVSRGEDIEFVRYDVKNGDNGSQTFRYAIRYSNPEDGIRYYAVSGSYDAAAKKYVCAAGTVESEGADAETLIETALDSLSIK